MVQAKTVLILGAGASEPYGFPLGDDLQRRIWGNLSNVVQVMEQRFKAFPERPKSNDFSGIMLDCGFDYKDLNRFRTELMLAMQPSIDAFLEKRIEFLNIGKAAIAASLIPFENEVVLYSRRPIEGKGSPWYEYLFNQMVAGKEFAENPLAVVTFNYDRSLEYFLFTALQHSYGLSEKDSADLLKNIPIIHVYGQLGKPHFWDQTGRPYSSEVDQAVVKKCLSEIHIIHEQSALSTEIEQARALINGAAIVCFLGFRYHPINVERLGVNELEFGKKILGSVYKLEADEIRKVTNLFTPFLSRLSERQKKYFFELGKETEDVLKFLKNHPVFD